MDEAARQTCLKVMGIQSYFPRFILPGAPQPLDLSTPEAGRDRNTAVPGSNDKATAPAVEQVNPEQQNTARPDYDRTNNRRRFPLLDDADPSETDFSAESNGKEFTDAISVTANNPPNSAAREELTEAPAEIRIQLSFLSVNNRLCILNQLPYLGKGSLGQAQKKLVANILVSLGISGFDELLPESSFKWPMAESKMLDKSPAAALLALKAYLLEKHHELQFDALLIMGSQLAELFTPGQDGIGNNFPFKMLFTKSLDEMLALPGHKKEAWLSLRALHQTD